MSQQKDELAPRWRDGYGRWWRLGSKGWHLVRTRASQRALVAVNPGKRGGLNKWRGGDFRRAAE